MYVFYYIHVCFTYMLCGCRQQCLGPSHHSMVLPHSTTLAYYSTRTSATCTTTSSLLLTPILVPYQCRSLHYQLPWGWGALPFREPGVPKEGLLPHWMSCRMQTTYIYIYTYVCTCVQSLNEPRAHLHWNRKICLVLFYLCSKFIQLRSDPFPESLAALLASLAGTCPQQMLS